MPAKVIWKSRDYRIVKRDTSRWREGVFDVEQRSEDALGIDAWHQVECYSYDSRDSKTAVMLDIIRSLEMMGQ